MPIIAPKPYFAKLTLPRTDTFVYNKSGIYVGQKAFNVVSDIIYTIDCY